MRDPAAGQPVAGSAARPSGSGSGSPTNGPSLTVLSALRIEARAVAGPVVVTGMGPRRAHARATRLAEVLPPGVPVAIVGVAGGLEPSLSVGDLVVATEVRTAGGTASTVLPGADLLAAELRRGGATVHTGPVVSVPSLVRAPGQRARLAADGALAVDMESAYVGEHLAGSHPFAVVRAVSDTAGTGVVAGGLRALRGLRGLRPALERWAGAVGPHDIVLAAPRSFCAGVERAVEIVERALARYGAPVYVRRQIVHNIHVVERLEAAGAVFVQELDEVPDASVVVIAAHGVSPAVRTQAAARPSLTVIDATCPLVAKVHHEARRYVSQGFRTVLIGHADHEEVMGTLGEAPGHITLVEELTDVAGLGFGADEPVAYLTQTTLATDETGEIVEALRSRYPTLTGPHGDDICYTTQNRQDAVRSLAGRCDLMLVVGSANSSNTARLAEVARREGCRAELVEDAASLRLAWFDGVGTVGLTAGASAPELLVQQVLDSLRTLGPARVDEHRTTEETVRFSLPQQVR